MSNLNLNQWVLHIRTIAVCSDSINLCYVLDVVFIMVIGVLCNDGSRA